MTARKMDFSLPLPILRQRFDAIVRLLLNIAPGVSIPANDFYRYLGYVADEMHPHFARVLDCSVTPDCECMFCIQN
jgi:hypothetical protein